MKEEETTRPSCSYGGGGDGSGHLPTFFVLVQAHAAWAQSDDEEETADDWHGLEEIVLQEVMQWLVGFDGPEWIGDYVEHAEEDDQSESAQLGLVANGDEYHQSCAKDVNENVHDRHVGADESQKHEDEENASGELHVVLWLVVAESGHASEQALGIGFALDQQKQETASQWQVAQ